MDEPDPIAWTAIPERHPVLSRDGDVIGYVAVRLGDESNGRFDGIALGVDVTLRADPVYMVEVDQVSDITTAAVHTTIAAGDVEGLPPYEEDRVYEPGRERGFKDRVADKFEDGMSAWDRKK